MPTKRSVGRRGRAGIAAVLIALFASAIPALAPGAGQAETPLADWDRRSDGSAILDLVIHEQPLAAPAIRFVDAVGTVRRLEEFRGKVTALHFWATWCVPCRYELPTVDYLQGEVGTENFVVIPLSLDRDGLAAVQAYYRDTGIANLPIFMDEGMQAARAMKIFGIPFTVFVDREGREFARVVGDRDWSDPDVVALVRKMID